MIYGLIVFLIIMIIVTIFYSISLMNSIFYKVPQVSTFNEDLKLLEKVFDKYLIKNGKILDLGSGRGKMLRIFEKKYKMHSTGFEIDLSNVIISKIINKFFGYKNKSIRKNYFKGDLSEFDFIYVYLFPILMKKVEEKIWKSSKPGTIIIVNAFKFEKHKPLEVFQKNGKDKIFVYKV